MGQYSFKRGIVALYFGVKYATLSLPIIEEPWRTRCTMGSPQSLIL